MFIKKRVLITGGTGSFGQAVLARLLRSDVAEVRILSRDEKKQDDMRKSLRNERVSFFIGDVRDPCGLDAAMSGVDYVFHAAALKQVPSCEFFPLEAVKTNILGTENVLNAAVRAGVRKIVCLSTDKAVYPINAMGLSKALMEKVFVAKSRTVPPEKTLVCGTRYGNVMASRGSVIPLFLGQIESGLPLTVTDPEMTRFMMTLDDAVDLVLHAFEHAETGDVYVQKSPACTIGALAETLKRMLGAENPVQVIGTRHGEKLYETLLTREEMAHAEERGNYFRIPADKRGLNYEKYFEQGSETVSRGWEYTSHNTHRLSPDELEELLLRLPEVRAAASERGRAPQ